jgi:hypothetical protein
MECFQLDLFAASAGTTGNCREAESSEVKSLKKNTGKKKI